MKYLKSEEDKKFICEVNIPEEAMQGEFVKVCLIILEYY